MPSFPLRLAVVCMSNMNRSMEAHSILRKKGFSVRSFGAGSCVKLPGPTPTLHVVYDFSTTHKQMYDDLLRKDRDYYGRNGLLHILGRNERIKPRPERFQECSDRFDVIFTCEESVYDRVVADLYAREQETLQPVHVINVDVKDTLRGAALGAVIICELCQGLQDVEDLEGDLDKLLLAVEKKTGKSFLHTVCFY
ncbi:RNA polymerase II subunit A C-terminal domain phosphatase SSU72-like [Pteropus medius]|uniref:RNA polymerase II subunit A C-terminal domain phosphatase SSU72-like n=1 Tax=Pteropus vampyrus TaxID=132908 RepID=UPI00196AF79F|nr:RNA polymerase II subunit A C-terminal domain phosphatase SSU72-like [Pteropus giganteus]